MTDLVLNGENWTTVKELSATIGVPERTIHNAIDRIMPGIKQNGQTTLLSEQQVAMVTSEIKKAHNSELASSGKVITTDIEMMERAADVMRWLTDKVAQERAARIEAERRNAVLMHVKKTYTATEIAKECGMKSANQLNKVLEEKGIQYKINGTWVLKSDFADLGYTSIKQGEADNGHVYYDRHFTQDGRAFILDLLKDK
jgi:hypothetical protein